MMDFARKQLEKYGWKDGMGLGKNEDGISAPIKAKLKFDNSGVGHNGGVQFTNNWWEKIFNTAAENISIEVDESDDVQMNVKDKDLVEITTKTYSVKDFKKMKNLAYGSFLKTSKLTQEGIEDYDVAPPPLPEAENNFQALTDEELFAACGGRTAHKGARHGLKLTGKLSRIEKQEKMLLKKMKKVSLSDEGNSKVEKKLKKLKKHKENALEKHVSEECSSSSVLPLKKKNKKRKSVSFSSTVTQIYTADLDTSLDSELAGQGENSNEPLAFDNINSGSDEGIEQDYENNNNSFEDNHKAFEEARLYINDLSKAERKKLKKKRKLEAKLNSKTNMFLAELECTEDEVMIEDKDANTKKRKHLEEVEHMGCKRSQYSETESPGRIKTKSLKKKRKKQRKLEEKQLNSIAKSLDSVCRISDCE